MLCNILATDYRLKYIIYLPQKQDLAFHANCVESGKNEKNIINLSFYEFTKKVPKHTSPSEQRVTLLQSIVRETPWQLKHVKP